MSKETLPKSECRKKNVDGKIVEGKKVEKFMSNEILSKKGEMPLRESSNSSRDDDIIFVSLSL
jgi:hypothetical protein